MPNNVINKIEDRYNWVDLSPIVGAHQFTYIPLIIRDLQLFTNLQLANNRVFLLISDQYLCRMIHSKLFIFQYHKCKR